MKKLISFKNYSFLFVFTFLLFAQISFGTILEKMDTEKLTKKSHLIIIAKVTNIRCEWDEQWKLIFTYVTVSTDQYIKGNSLKNEIEIMFPGGIVGSKRLFVDGTPKFVKGEKVLLFLEPEIKNTYRVVGWYQGKNTIENSKIVGTNKSVKELIDSITNIMDKNPK